MLRYDPLFLAWDFHCSSPEEQSRIGELVYKKSRPDAVLIDSLFSAGVTSEVVHRIGDYFEKVLVLPEVDGDPCKLRLVFHRHPSAGRFWKDVMIRIMRAVQDAGQNVKVSLVYQGDECLDWLHLVRA
jgi:hypothetical protein